VIIGELLDELAAAVAGPLVPPDRATARDLIAALLDRPRFWPTAHRDEILAAGDVEAARAAAARLREGMPLAYAVGRAAFRRLTLKVDRRVLIPRQETEQLVDVVLAQTGGAGTVADIGTGSGAIALALASEGNYERVIATERSEGALEVARSNLNSIPAHRRSVVEFRRGDLCEPLRGERVGAVVSNPPYIAPEEAAELPASVRDWEPTDALFSEANGMAATYDLLRTAPDVLLPGGVLVVEVDARRGRLARARAATDGRYRDVELLSDLTGRERFLVARRQES
jgi:release factor glutamine methyltransferase